MNVRWRGERGVTLVETLVAVGIIGAALVVFLAGLSTGLLSTSAADRLSTAHELARSQMEYTKSLPFVAPPHAYPTVTPPAGYAVSADASGIPGGDSDVALITVVVTKDSATIYSLEGYKVNR